MRIDSSTEVSGMANCSPPARTTSAWMMASVIGSITRNVVPTPGVERMSIVPFSSWMFFFTTSRPTPRPEISLTVDGREAGGEEKLVSAGLVDDVLLRGQPALDGRRAD